MGWKAYTVSGTALAAALAVGSWTISAQEEDANAEEYGPLKEWESRAIPESQGKVDKEEGIQHRYGFGGFGRIDESFHDWPTHAYDDDVEYPEPEDVTMPDDIEGDPEKGKELFADRDMAPCSACHLTDNPELWPAGNVGPDLRLIGHRDLPDDWLYQVVHDARVIFGDDSPMPPFGTAGMWSEQEIMHVVSYLQTQTGDPPGTPKVPEGVEEEAWNPWVREPRPTDYGDDLDPLDNPALGEVDDIAVPLWSEEGPKGESCANCHGEIGEPDELRQLGVIEEMEGVGSSYPKWYDEFGRMLSVEDFLAIHAEEETGHELPAQSLENMTMSILVRMQDNDQPHDMDLDHPGVQAAVERGEELFNRSIGQRYHSCANCHTDRGGGGTFLGGRFLANIEEEGSAMINHPYWRTAQSRIWDIRTRMQWCMTPLGANYLPGDSPEYADLETYIMSQQQGEPVRVPRQSH